MAFQPFQVKAVYEYTSPHEDDLHFPNGQIITVVEEEDEDWYAGEYTDANGVKQEGIFPRNFVERYTPQAPPRPNRAARPKKTEAPPAPEPEAAPTPPAPEPVAAPKEPEAAPLPPAPVEEPEPVQAPAAVPIPAASEPAKEERTIVSPPAPKAVPAAPAAVKSPPPPAAEKPISGSFRDRIAAFNKAAPPPVPYKPGGNGAGSFIKKPFVAPPPSKNAYIPPPQQAPVAKIYRRDEDPEIAAREQEDRDNAEKAGLAPTSNKEGEEEQPKPTSLKERIALLQKQQAEQAARHAESSAAAKKEKPKKVVKKKSETEGAPIEGEEAPLEHTHTHETTGSRRSLDESAPEERQIPIRRKSSRGPPPPPPARAETDGNDADMSGAGDETEGGLDTPIDDSDRAAKQHVVGAPAPPARQPDVGDEEDTTEDQPAEDEDEEEDEDDIDPEVRRKEEIRARMAKMSGGMGMMGMFGGGMPMPGPPPPKKKKAVEKQHSEEHEELASPSTRAPPVPIFPMPGMAKVKSPEETNKAEEDEVDVTPHAPTAPGFITGAHAPEDVADIEDVAPTPPPHTERPVPSRPSVDQDRREPPAPPGGRPAPPPVPTASRPMPPPLGPMSPSAGSASDDEMSQAGFSAMRTPTGDTPKLPPSLPSRNERPASSKQSEASYFPEATPASPGTTGQANKRQSRVPPIPGTTPGTTPGANPQQTRPPPPLPPHQTLSRSSTGDLGARPPTPKAHPKLSDEEEVTEYEGDYDTDIAPTTHHKDALKAAEEEEDDSAPPPMASAPPSGAPSGLPPRLMNQPPSLSSSAQPPLPLSGAPPIPNAGHHRQSSDMPRGAPPPPPRDLPPPPIHKSQTSHQDYQDDGEEYDPFNYSSLPKSNPPPPPPVERMASYSRGDDYDDDIYAATPPRSPPPVARNAPPPPPREAPPQLERQAPPAPPRESRDFGGSRESASRGRASMDVRRGDGRRSMDMSRLAMEHDFIANEIDLGESTMWWAQKNGVPPVFHGRKDILHETEESTATKRGGKSITTKDLYVLFPDYSQTIITVQFDTNNPSEASIEQKHEAPPAKLRPDQLEESHERYGRRLHEAVVAKKESVVGDGTPAGLIVELLKPLKDALLPIGTRAYGALVYSNQGNSLVGQYDEIRPGDVITFRNTKFMGKHGPMHAKYTAELGKGEGHVAIVAEWDGAKKKVRAWEQGRESKKVKMESFKLEDLRSGEVKIWRVMGRAWVGWEGQNS